MRDSKLPLILLIVLLVGGLGVGAWFLFGQDADTRGPDHNFQTADSADAEPGKGNGGTTGRADDNQDEPGNVGSTGKDPAKEAAPNKADATVKGPGTDPDAAGPDAPVKPDIEVQWTEKKMEFTVTGTVRYHADSRPAVGAAVTAEAGEGLRYWLDGGRSGETSAREGQPATKVSGETTTDGAGEFTLKLSITWYEEGGPIGMARRIRFGEEPWVPSVNVVARMSGYAPARSRYLRLKEGGTERVDLALAVPAAVTGRVIDGATRAGIQGASVTLWNSEQLGDANRAITTDADGYFSANDLPAAQYYMWVSAEGYSTQDGWETRQQVDLSKGGETNIGDIPLSKTATVVGLIVNSDGEPVAKAACRLQHAGSTDWRGGSESGRSGDDGKFEIKNVEPGSYMLSVRSDDHGVAEKDDVRVESGKATDVGTIRLELGESLTGRVVDSGGAGIAGASVTLRQQRDDNRFINMSRGTRISGTETGPDGAFTITSVPQGEMMVSVEAKGYAELDHNFKFPCAPLTLKLVRGGTLTGRVVGADGNPVDGAGISLMSHDSPQYTMWKASPQQMWWNRGDEQTTSSESGRFTIESLTPGTYLVLCNKQGESGAHKDNVVVENVKLTDAGDIRMGGKGAIRITVTEKGEPAQGVMVGLNRGFSASLGDHQAKTDMLGIGEIRDLPAGPWYVRTSRDGGSFDTESLKTRGVTIKAGETVEFKVELRPSDSVRLHGRLTMNGKASLKEIYLVGKGDQTGIVKNADCKEGYYEFNNVTPGRYNLYGSPDDTSLGGMVPLDLTEPGELEITRDFRGFVVSGTVTTPEGTPTQNSAVGVALQRTSSDDEFGSFVTTRVTCDAQGAFKFEGICAGSYTLTAVLEGVGTARSVQQVENSDRTGLNLAIDDNVGSMRIRVSKVTGTPVSGAGFGMTRVIDAAGNAVPFSNEQGGWFMVQEGGGVTLPNITPGTYSLEVSASGYLPATKSNIQVTKGNRAEVELELTAAAELHATCTNVEITQAMLDKASVRYMDAQGREIPVSKNLFDAWATDTPPERPTLKVGYIGSGITELRIKLAGYAELPVQVQFAAGKKIEQELTFVAE
jgi:hypothetical protein